MTKHQKLVWIGLIAIMVGAGLGYVASAAHADLVFQIAEGALHLLMIAISVIAGIAIVDAILKAGRS